jgi:hypothetical protein
MIRRIASPAGDRRQSLAETRDQRNSQGGVMDPAQREIARLTAMADELRAIEGSTSCAGEWS